MKLGYQIDWEDVLVDISVPTLVLHRTGDLVAPVRQARKLAEGIPDAKYVELPGVDHLMWVGDQDAIVREVEAFVEDLGPAVDTRPSRSRRNSGSPREKKKSCDWSPPASQTSKSRGRCSSVRRRRASTSRAFSRSSASSGGPRLQPRPTNSDSSTRATADGRSRVCLDILLQRWLSGGWATTRSRLRSAIRVPRERWRSCVDSRDQN